MPIPSVDILSAQVRVLRSLCAYLKTNAVMRSRTRLQACALHPPELSEQVKILAFSRCYQPLGLALGPEPEPELALGPEPELGPELALGPEPELGLALGLWPRLALGPRLVNLPGGNSAQIVVAAIHHLLAWHHHLERGLVPLQQPVENYHH